MKEFFFTHNVSRAVTPMEGHRGPPVLFYLIALAIGTFPWSLWLLPMASQLKQRWQVDPKFRPAMMLGLAWIAVYIVVFSIAATKLPSYITPCYPGAALLIGAMLARWIRNQENSVNWIQAGLLIAVVVGLGIGISAGAINIRGQHLTAPLAPAGTLLAIASLGAIWLVSRRRVDLGIRLYTAGAVAMVISLASLAPMLVDRSRTELETIARAQTVSPEVAFVGEVEPSWIFYSQGTAHCLQDADWQAAAVEFLNTSTARALITNRAQANELKAHLYATHPSLQLEEQRNPGEDLVVVRIHPAPTGLAQRDGRRY